MAWIYILENKINGKIYVGQTININNRLQNHKKNYTNSVIGSAIIKYGWDNFNKYIFECDEEDLDYFERGFINQMNTLSPNGYNLHGGGNSHREISEETRLKMSKSAIGKIISTEARRKISYASSHLSEENRHKMSLLTKKSWEDGVYHNIGEKIRKSKVGKKHSTEAKIKMSLAKMGKYIGGDNPSAKKIICMETGEIFNSEIDAVRKYKLCKSVLSRCCNRKAKSCGGFHWAYYEAL